MDSSRATAVREDSEEFFIGYAPPMPPRLRRSVSKVVIGLACGALASAVILGAGHVAPEGGTFEFGHRRSFTGTIVERPYPALRLDGPDPKAASLLLVAPGKHGAEALVSGLEGRFVTLEGTRIRRGAHTMIEVDPASFIVDQGSASRVTAAAVQARSVGDRPVTVRGEIVDSKCFLGVMVPGSGKTHEDCASLCIRGGIPPALYVQDRAGDSVLMLLAGTAGESVGAQALPFAGEAIDVTGTIEQQDGWLVLRTDPRTWRSVEP